ncbi:MFS transporter [Nocardioides zeae]|uniref:MFS transporter n=1 Tax=Nocardioides imazamoxiresistens TaxID=3231893 RepID=A0ABU3PXW8_9ACTN|nr:MFS transporter [Nocardioides zeae]MDT9594083.1 MFS transporter [Nocardioides zeae]
MSTAPTSAPTVPPAGKSNLRKVVAASMAGTVVEWYEFFVYATAAILVFPAVFFPESDPTVGTIAALGTYAVGFIARPIGGLVFGHYGDKFGRKQLLQLSIVLVGVSTFLMGALPGHAQIGVWAAVLLIVLRFVQGFAVGGEWGGAVLLVAEHAPDNRRGYWASYPQAGVPIGNLIATLVMLGLSAGLSEQAFLDWGWRIAFFASAIIVLVGWYIRTKVEDAPIFKAAVEKEEAEKASRSTVLEVVKYYPKQVLTAMGLRFCENIMYYMVVTFTISYLRQDHIGFDVEHVLLLLLVGHLSHVFVVPAVGLLSDIWGRKPVYLLGVLGTATWGFWAFPMMDTGSDVQIILAVVLGLAIQGLMYAPQPSLMSEMFPTKMRYAGVSLGYQVTAIAAGSMAPIIAVALLDRYDSTTPIAFYLAGAAVVSLVALAFAKETRGSSLTDLDDVHAAR